MGFPDTRNTAAPGSQKRFGTHPAIQLMRSLPTKQNPELVAMVIASTLESLDMNSRTSSTTPTRTRSSWRLDREHQGQEQRLENEIERGVDEIVKLEASLAKPWASRNGFGWRTIIRSHASRRPARSAVSSRSRAVSWLRRLQRRTRLRVVVDCGRSRWPGSSAAAGCRSTQHARFAARSAAFSTERWKSELRRRRAGRDLAGRDDGVGPRDDVIERARAGELRAAGAGVLVATIEASRS